MTWMQTLHGNTRCLMCRGRHDGANLVKRHWDTGDPVHVLCLDDYQAWREDRTKTALSERAPAPTAPVSPSRFISMFANLTARQRDGIDCIVCGRADGIAVVAGRNPETGAQLFRCENCERPAPWAGEVVPAEVHDESSQRHRSCVEGICDVCDGDTETDVPDCSCACHTGWQLTPAGHGAGEDTPTKGGGE